MADDRAQQRADHRPGRWASVAMAALTFCVVAGVAGVGWYRLEPGRPLNVPRAGAPGQQQAAQIKIEPGPALVTPGDDYYVHVKLVELRAKKPDGDAWDFRGGPPDVFYEIDWNGTRLYQSDEREDRLIAEWDLLRLDLQDAILSGQVEVSSAINAPLIRAEAGGVLRIVVKDEDTSFDDEAARFDLPVDALKVGTTTLEPAEGGVLRLVLDVVPRDTSLPDLLDRASRR